MIRRINSLTAFDNGLKGCVVAIGNFDGVHRGHQAVLDTALDNSRDKGLPAVVLTFEPHPRSVFRPDVPLPRITPAPMKADILQAMGFDAVVEMPFTRDFAALTADQFIDDVLATGLGARHVVTGFDFHFGKNRQGGPAYLMDASKTRDFQVTLVDAFRDENGDVISSSRIREALATGDLSSANGALGYRYRVAETVIEGKQLGRTLGYPTANMALAAETPLAHGIYAVRFMRDCGTVHDGVASFGRRPTVDADGVPVLETFVFDFTGDLYGTQVTVCFCGFLRGEEKFNGLDALMEQMQRDEAEARALLAGLSPLSGIDASLTFAQDLT